MRSTSSKSRRGRGNRHAFMTIDLVVGFGIVVVLSTSLIVILSRAGRISRSLSDSRALAREAESALIDLQAGRSHQKLEGFAVTTTVVAGEAPLAGYSWIRVSASANGHSVAIVGLVANRSAPTTSPAGPTTREGRQ